jgi:tetratricopeptide (TPR) repeat protein
LSLEVALKLHPQYSNALNNFGLCHLELGNFAKAEAAFKSAIDAKPTHLEAMRNLGHTYAVQNDFDNAKIWFRRAILINQSDAETNYSLGRMLVKNYQFKEGFGLFDWRWRTAEKALLKVPAKTRIWDGKHKQSVLLWAEQGVGEEIMFASMISEASALSQKTIVQCDKRLIPLFKRSFSSNIIYVDRITPLAQSNVDFHLPFGSLPILFRKSIEAFRPSSEGYLKNDPAKTAIIRENIVKTEKEILIGVSWRTFSRTPNAKKRNIDLIEIVSRLRKRGIKFVSLQYGEVEVDIKDVEAKLGVRVMQLKEIDVNDDFLMLGNLIKACDVVISIDNAVAHLSGALGATTKLLLPYDADWRWGANTQSSYWYDSVEILRQSHTNDWSIPLAKLSEVSAS